MRKFTPLTVLAFVVLISSTGIKAQNVGIGVAVPNVSASLDITATNKGLLIPRVSLTSLTDKVTIATPATGLLVYNTNPALINGTGFYYNAGTTITASWLKLQDGTSSTSWNLTGNTDTDSTANFLGTTDANPIMFRVNNTHAGIIGSAGGLSLGRGSNGLHLITAPGVVAYGDSALYSNLDSNEIAIGNSALYSNTIGQSNTAIGNFNLSSNTIGSANVAIGDLSLVINDTADLNTGVGYRSLLFTVADENTGVGAFSLENNFSGFYNTAIGGFSLNANDNGIGNTGIGDAALYSNITGDINTAVGLNALFSNDAGIRNTASGYLSLANSVAGSGNTAYGSFSLQNITTGNFNTAIGDSADVSAAGGAFFNTTAIGYKAVATANNTISIGNNFVTAIRGQVGFSTFSDGRYKKDVNEDVKGLSFIMQLRPVSYHYDFNKIRTDRYNGLISSTEKNSITTNAFNFSTRKLNSKLSAGKNFALNTSKRMVNSEVKAKANPVLARYYEEVQKNDQIRYTGFIAQEVEAAASKVGFDFSGVDKPKNESDQYALRYAEFVVPLVKAVQEQQAIIDAQNKKIEELIKRLEKLEQPH